MTGAVADDPVATDAGQRLARVREVGDEPAVARFVPASTRSSSSSARAAWSPNCSTAGPPRAARLRCGCGVRAPQARGPSSRRTGPAVHGSPSGDGRIGSVPRHAAACPHPARTRTVQPLPGGHRRPRAAAARTPRPGVPRGSWTRRPTACGRSSGRRTGAPCRCRPPGRRAWRRRSSTPWARATSSSSRSTACSGSGWSTSPRGAGPRSSPSSTSGAAGRRRAGAGRPPVAEADRRRARRDLDRGAVRPRAAGRRQGRRAAAGRLRDLARRHPGARWTTGASTSPTPARRSASASRPGSRRSRSTTGRGSGGSRSRRAGTSTSACSAGTRARRPAPAAGPTTTPRRRAWSSRCTPGSAGSSRRGWTPSTPGTPRPGGCCTRGSQELGLELFAAEGHRLPELTTVRVPDGVDSAAVRKELLERYDLEIGGGVGAYAATVWRIGLMGANATPDKVAAGPGRPEGDPRPLTRVCSPSDAVVVGAPAACRVQHVDDQLRQSASPAADQRLRECGRRTIDAGPSTWRRREPERQPAVGGHQRVAIDVAAELVEARRAGAPRTREPPSTRA